MGLCFFGKNDQNHEKMTKSKKFGRKFLWSESIPNALKRIFKQKSQNRKFFSVQNFFRGTLSFSAKIAKVVEKIFGPNRLRIFPNVF